MATATQYMAGDATFPRQIIVTYNTTTLVCSQIQIINNDTRNWGVTVTNANTTPATVYQQTVAPGTNKVIPTNFHLQAVQNDDGTTGVTWPVGWSVNEEYPV